MILLPSSSPELSPIENCFGFSKAKLRDMKFDNKE